MSLRFPNRDMAGLADITTNCPANIFTASEAVESSELLHSVASYHFQKILQRNLNQFLFQLFIADRFFCKIID